MRFRRAVLFIHGFTGCLADNEYFVNELQFNRRFDVFAWTLPGHNKDVIGKVKREDWVMAVEKQIEELIKNGYNNIYVVGHSMGGILTSKLAIKYRQIKKIVLIAPAFDCLSPEQYKDDLKNFSDVINDEDVNYKNIFIKMIRTTSAVTKEFHKLINENQDLVKKIKTPCLIIHGDKDEVVPVKSSKNIFDKIKSKDKTLTLVKNGRHNILKGKRKEDVTNYIEIYLVGGLKWKLMKKSII